MRITPIATTASLCLALTLTGCSSYTVDDCRKALTKTSSATNRPDECSDLSQQEYDALLLDKAVGDAVNGLNKDDRDALDYGDDGQLNDSLTDD